MAQTWRMPHRNGRRAPRELDLAALNDLAIAYVGRFATSRAKLRIYLRRKLRERGWQGDGEPPIETLVERLSAAGYVNDAGFALAKSRSLVDRGYGVRRVSDNLRAAGISEDDGAAALDLAIEQAADSALRFARRRRIGPWSTGAQDREMREKWIGAMVRAGHSLALARRIASSPPGTPLSVDVLNDTR